MATDPLRDRLGELHDLRAVTSLLHWDMLVTMPPAGLEARAEQLATLERLAHERLVDPAMEALLDAADPGDEAVAVVRRDREKALRVPAELVGELARAGAAGQAAWEHARERGDFAAYAPHLERVVELRRRYAACFPEAAHPYDALLDDFDPGRTTGETRAVLGAVRDGLRPLVAHARANAGAVDTRPLAGPFDAAGQRGLLEEVLGHLGVDDEAWRIDVSTHPFQASIGLRDVRLTTRYDEASLESLFSGLHEFGHGLYESQIDRALARSPLQEAPSMTVHESQSRLWENMVGRSRGFWRWCAPIAGRHLPGLAGTDPEALWRAAGEVRPSLVRVDADEVTYGLHVVLRFELELALLDGSLAVEDLPARWGEGMRELLGVEVPDDRVGVLQDPHWSEGAFGYFPTYALGNVLAGQLWAEAQRELGDLDARFAEGDFAGLRAWLRDRVHAPGRSFRPARLEAGPYLGFLRAKVEALYGPMSAADALPQDA